MASADHQSGRPAGEREGGDEVRLQEGADRREVVVEQGAAIAHADVVDQDVEAPLLLDPDERRLGRRLVGDVKCEDRDAPPFSGDALGGGLKDVGGAAVQPDLGAGESEQPRRLEPEPAAGPRHQGRLAREVERRLSHGAPPGMRPAATSVPHDSA